MNYHVDGRVVPAAEATIPVDDRGFRYGDCVVEPVRIHGGAPLAWDAHADRIATSCDRLSIPCPDDLRARVDDLVASGVGEALLSGACYLPLPPQPMCCLFISVDAVVINYDTSCD